GTDVVGYGKFSNAYPRLRDYLENLPYTQVSPSLTSMKFAGRNRQVTGSITQTFNLNVQTGSAVPVLVEPDAPWLLVAQPTGTVSASQPAQIQVSLDPKYFVTSDVYSSTLTILSGAAPPQYVNVSMDMKLDISSVSVSASPNPVPQNNGTWTV